MLTIMADEPHTQQAGSTQTADLSIPADVQEKFGPIIALIKSSESMNDEERQYWINILPIMTPDQMKSLEDILVNEKTQLAAIDQKYSQQTAPAAEGRAIEQIQEERTQKKAQRTQTEQEEASKKQEEEADILKKIQDF